VLFWIDENKISNLIEDAVFEFDFGFYIFSVKLLVLCLMKTELLCILFVLRFRI
jgi:hypothetical protein